MGTGRVARHGLSRCRLRMELLDVPVSKSSRPIRHSHWTGVGQEKGILTFRWAFEPHVKLLPGWVFGRVSSVKTSGWLFSLVSVLGRVLLPYTVIVLVSLMDNHMK